VQTRTPGSFPEAINLGDTSNLVTEVDIYHLYNDTTDTDSVTFYWEPELSAETSGEVTAQGLGVVRDT